MTNIILGNLNIDPLLKTQKKYSDLDICYKDFIEDAIISKIQEAFEESDLPFKVELLDWNRCDADFQNSLEKELVRVEDAKPVQPD